MSNEKMDIITEISKLKQEGLYERLDKMEVYLKETDYFRPYIECKIFFLRFKSYGDFAIVTDMFKEIGYNFVKFDPSNGFLIFTNDKGYSLK